MQQIHDETHATNKQQAVLSTGPGAHQIRLPGEVIPTALFGPAQQGREPLPIILPHIAIGRAVAPNIPVLPPAMLATVPPLAAGYQPTVLLAPVTNEGERGATGAHEQHPEQEERAETPGEPIAPPPKASPGQERGYPVITTPIPTPGDLSHTTPFPSSSVQRQAQQWSPRHPQLFLV